MCIWTFKLLLLEFCCMINAARPKKYIYEINSRQTQASKSSIHNQPLVLSGQMTASASERSLPGREEDCQLNITVLTNTSID